MNPVLLQKQFRDNTKDLQNFCKELKEWGEEMKRKEEPSKSDAANDAEVPPSRNKVQKIEHANETEEKPKTTETKKSKRIKSCDYKAWEKFNADAYCERIDKETVGEPLSDDASDDLSDEYDGSVVELANCEKEKGNVFVKKQRWDDAIKCYTKAIECYAYEPIFYANRALCHLKKQNYRNAESDCTAAIQLDKKYVKAYQRRAAARESLNQLNEARDDLLRVLELEKKNAESKAALVKLEKKIEDSKQPVAENRRPISKFTLSRQKQKHPTVPEATGSKNEEIPAIKAHVVEKVRPSLPPKFEDWPGGNGVELYASLPRPRKSRSAGPLKRIEIIDVDLQIEPQVPEGLTKNILETVENESKLQASVSKNEEDTLRLVEEMFQRNAKPIPSPPTNEAKQSVVKQENSDLRVPRTSVQFYLGWRSVGADHDFRYRYMKRINPKELPDIFKESLESKVFGEMIETLSAARDRNFIHDWLMQLTNVKRFSALVMFMSPAEKRRVSDLVAYLREDNKFDEVEELRKKYEL